VSDFPTAVPLSLYIHIPWCVRKCPYCDFNSHQAPATLPERSYIDALLLDLQQDLTDAGRRPIHSVFIGGGTPGLLSAEAINRLLEGLRRALQLQPDAEITLEANPGTVEQHKFREFRHIGINRLSIGVQSFNDDHLRRLGRIHGGAEAAAAAESAYAAGFENFNLDLMFGLPQQSLSEALDDVARAITLGPTHLSYYQLTLESGTPFFKHPPSLPNDDMLWAAQARCQELLAINGYTQYEVSAYARPGRKCRHNVGYWQFGDYLGIGAGAHAKLSDPDSGEIVRLWKCRQPRDYLAKAGTPRVVAGREPISPEDLGLEFMMNALRLTDGFPASLFTQRTGHCLHHLDRPLAEAERRGLLTRTNGHIRPTRLGQRFLNNLLELF
jgi:oxygen-independent coproporphyrinogen-3 oxidase